MIVELPPASGSVHVRAAAYVPDSVALNAVEPMPKDANDGVLNKPMLCGRLSAIVPAPVATDI